MGDCLEGGKNSEVQCGSVREVGEEEESVWRGG